MNPLLSAWARDIRCPNVDESRIRRGQRKVAQRTVKPWLEMLEDRCLLSYAMIDLGTLGGQSSTVVGLNASGQVAGVSQTASGGYDSFVWDSSHGMQDIGSGEAVAINNSGQVVGDINGISPYGPHAFAWDSLHGMQDLGTLGGNTSQALAINNSGQVVGTAEIAPGIDHAFVWDSLHGMRDLGTLGGKYSQANAINDFGQVVGYAYDASRNEHAFVWDSLHGMQDLGTLGGGNEAQAIAINDSGQVVGDWYDAIGDSHAFVWDSIHGMQDLGTLGGILSQATAINNSGQVVGLASTASGANHAFVWDSIHGMQDLGTLGGDLSQAHAINNSGQVVGEATNAIGAFHALVWDNNHGMQDLYSLVGNSEGGSSNALAINDSGFVSGSADTGSGTHAFLAGPRPNSPVFSDLSSSTITYGPAATLSGHLADGSLTPPAGERVSVTLNGVTQNAVLDSNGNFSTTFSTGSFHAGRVLAVDYFYAGDSSFGAASDSSTLSVQPAPLTITADNQTKFYSAALPTLTASYSGFVNGDTAASLTILPSLSTSATAASPVGTYPITVAGASDPDYTISYVGGTLSVITNDTTTTLTSSLSSISAGQPVTLTATVSAVAVGAGTPTGFVDFMDSASGTDLRTVPLSAGSASLTLSSLLEDSSLPGDIPHSIVATYEGDNNFLTSNSSAAPVTIVVTDVRPTVAITNQLPADASNNPTAPVGTLLSFGGSFSDSPAENRSLTSSDTVAWSVTLNGQPYSLTASTATNGPTLSFTPTTVGTYVVNLTIVDPDGGTASAQQTVDITSMDANSLQNLVNAEANSANPFFEFFGSNKPVPAIVTIQADPTQINAAAAALNSVVQPQVYDYYGNSYVPVDVTVTLNLTSGNYSDLNFSLQPPVVDNFDTGFTYYVSVVVNGVNGSTTVVGHSPALTITSGNVTVNNVTFTTATDAPTILVAGGSLALQNDVVQSSTGFADAAIAVSGGTVDLGSTGNPGNNIINVNGAGQFVQNTTSTPISTAGNTFESGGVVLPSSNLTDSTVSAGMAPVIPGQAVTLTATVASDSGSGTPTGSVTFVDTTSNITLGTAPLVAGVATLTTPLSGAVGTHLIQANYTGDNTFLPSLATASQALTQSIFVLNGTASAALSVSGNAGINIPGTLVVDSSSKTALTESGNAKITAAGIQVVGGVSKSGNATLSPAATTGVSVVANPLANLTGPSTSGLASYGAVSYSKGSSTLKPGIYKSISASGNASLTLNPGVYLIEGGGFTVSGNASIRGTGVTIYNTSSNYPSSTGSYGGITLSGNGTFALTAPSSGAYAGIVIFQPSANTRAISLSGNAADGLGGTIYAPSALLYVSGNASVNGALVVNELSLSGNAASTQSAAGSDADNAGSTAGQLLAGNVEVYVDNSNGDLTPDELARIQDAVNAVDALTAPYGVTVAEVSDPTQANVTLNMGTNSDAGGYAQGTLGCYTTTGQITLIQGWNWYAGADPTQIGTNQYDFQTTVTHELGHALGLGESNVTTSAMYGTLAPATAIRTLTTADLNIPYDEGPADAQRAAVPQVAHIATVVTSNSAASGPGMTAANRTSTASSSPTSGGDPLFAALDGFLSDLSHVYQSGLSSVSALWQTADALALQRLDALLSMEAGAMGVTKDTLMRDLLFASPSAPNGV